MCNVTELLRCEGLWIEGRPPGGRFQPIVKNVSFAVSRGEVVALIGESGSGKTTTSLATLGYARPGCRIAGGEVLLNGTDVLSLDSRARRRLRGNKVAYVAQSAAAAFNPSLTIEQQVVESATIHRLMPRSQARRRAVELYRKLDLPEPETLGARYPHQVSGGQLQRLMAAMAMASTPELLVLDEPTTALDVTTQIEVLTVFKDIIRTHGTAAIYVTHDLAVVAQIADRIMVMLEGEIVERGATEQIVHRPAHAYTKTLMAAVRLAPRDQDQAISGSDGDEPSEDASVVSVEHLSAGYGRARRNLVLRDVSIAVPRGQTVGIIGESGCGKSTLARVISGLLPPVSGRVLHHDRPLPGRVKDRERESLRRIQLVFQMPDVAINPRQRVRDVLVRPLEFFLGTGEASRRERIAELLEMVELPPEFESRFPAELSGGQKQRVNLARALGPEPEVILCDEVTSSLDTVVGAAIIDLLRHLQKRLGVTYLFISHDLSMVASFADRIVVLYAGQVAEQGPTADVLSPPHHPYTRLLLASVPELRTGWLEEVMHTREARSGISRAVQVSAQGCSFFERCPLAIEGLCEREPPPIRVRPGGHLIACHRTLHELDTGDTTH